MKHWVFFLEEPSAQDFFEAYLSRFDLPQVKLHFQVFEGKQDLEKRLEKRIRHWQEPNSRFLVMRDQDSGDCKVIKQKLRNLCEAANRHEAVVRIACRELETFFIGDWQAIADAFLKPSLANKARAAKYRFPDQIGSPSGELKAALGTYSKRAGARKITQCISPQRNRSNSFNTLNQTLMNWVEQDG